MTTGRLNRTWMVALALFFLAQLFSCGKPVNREAMGPDEYFEYAKKKFDDGDYFAAKKEFTVIVLRYGGDPVVDEAQYFLAESEFHLKEYLVAVSEYERLINDYPRSPYVPLAQFKIGMAYDKLSLRPELDQEYTLKALRAFQTFVEENPGHELVPQAEKFIAKLRAKLAKKKLIAATTYRKMGLCRAALVYYDIILESYYDTPAAAEAQYWKGVCLKKSHRLEEARTALSVFVEKYPDHRLANEARALIEEITRELQSQAPEEPQATTEQDGQH